MVQVRRKMKTWFDMHWTNGWLMVIPILIWMIITVKIHLLDFSLIILKKLNHGGSQSRRLNNLTHELLPYHLKFEVEILVKWPLVLELVKGNPQLWSTGDQCHLIKLIAIRRSILSSQQQTIKIRQTIGTKLISIERFIPIGQIQKVLLKTLFFSRCWTWWIYYWRTNRRTDYNNYDYPPNNSTNN